MNRTPFGKMANVGTNSFRELQVWQRSIEVAALIYQVTDRLPERERFGIQSQMRRSVVSISSNIAEGHGRRTNPDFARFVRIALGSCRETQSLLIVSQKIGLIEEIESLVTELEEIAKMLFGLLKHLEV